MRTILYILLLVTFSANIATAQTVCCPKFQLLPDMFPCDDTTRDIPPVPQTEDKDECDWYACKHTIQTYLVLPKKPGFTYTWAVTGAVPLVINGNSMKLKWNNVNKGKIKVFISNADGSCRDTIEHEFCLVDAPTANFTFSPASPLCLNQILQFNNTSTGATTTYWDFGDGSTSTQINPSHTYTTPGNYTITLAVSNSQPPKGNNGPGSYQEMELECGCRDTIRRTIVVKNEPGIIIEPGCKQMLCKGDTATYSTPNNCTSYGWSVTGGRIVGQANGKCITVVWDGSYPATVKLSGYCGGTCGNTGTLNVPVLFPVMPILGNNIVCPSSISSYSLPSMPGTFYTWTLGTGGAIIGANKNTSVINVQWGAATGTYTIKCHYTNPHTGCSGDGSIDVKILPPYTITGPKKFCVGNTFNFSANGAGTWKIETKPGFTPTTFTAGTSITGVWNKPGTYTVTANPSTPAAYCSYPAQLTVVVTDTPKLNAIIGPTLICPGSTVMYKISSNMTGGTYDWWPITGGTVTAEMGKQRDSVMIKWNTAGPYQVAVTQTVNGCKSSPKILNVVAHTPPLIAGVSSTCMDEEVVYTASGTAPAGGFNWTLGNGLGTITAGQGTNTIQVIWHGATPPNNTCLLKVTTCAGTDSKLITINTAQPLVISYAGNLCPTSTGTLTASLAGSGTYVWQLNGTTLPPPRNTQTIPITLAGTYTVTVDNNPCSPTATIIVPEEKLNITASVSTLDKTYWKCTEAINTTLHAIPGTGYCYQWFFSSLPNGIPTLINGATSSHYTANTQGYFWCRISVCGTSCTAVSNKIHIWKEGCVPAGSCLNNTIDFTIQNCNPAFSFTASSSPVAATGTFFWTFGDGDTAYNATVTHSYRDTGVYLVCALRSGNNGYCGKDTCKQVQVNIAANFSANVKCDKVTFTNLSKARLPITTYNWSFAGGTPASSNLQNPPIVTYANAGAHAVTLTITDGTCTTTLIDTVKTTSVVAVMNVPTPICAKTMAPFTATVSDTSLTYEWQFGDGVFSHLDSTSHAYQSAGNYTVTLTVTDRTGCIATYTKNITVLPEITVAIGGDKYLCSDRTVAFTATPAFATYQWYKDGVAIPGATSQTYNAGSFGEYWVAVTNGSGCMALSNHANVLYSMQPIADIITDGVLCTADGPMEMENGTNVFNDTYKWKKVSGPGPVTWSLNDAVYNPKVTATIPGTYIFSLEVTNSNGCKAFDTVCVVLEKSPTMTVTGPTGSLCAGQKYTFIAMGSPSISPDDYLYRWTNGAVGSTFSTGIPGSYGVFMGNPVTGCGAQAFAGVIRPRADVSLFPVGCDTLCLTDTLFFPLPTPNPTPYTITWYDDAGTAIANVGTGYTLPLATLHPGIHHLYATVSMGGCTDTTGKFDLYIKDCTLLPPCDNCTGLVEPLSLTADKTLISSGNSQIVNSTVTITILKPVKEIRISLADLKYYWNDSTCKNCKVQMIERGCLFPGGTSTSLGTLVWDDRTSSGPIAGAANNKCPTELVWKNGTPLQPGTYNIPVQLSVPKAAKEKCVLVLENLCFHVTIIDTTCKSCDKWICKKKGDDEATDCNCNAGNNWTSLYLLPKKLAIAKPRTQILCNSTYTGYQANVPYVLTGVYHCHGNCVSVKNEIVVLDQRGQIIYTRSSSLLNEAIEFPGNGLYTIVLTAYCGSIKCVCGFKILIAPDIEEPPVVKPPIKDPPVIITKIPEQIDSILKEVLPPDFNGGILVSKNDSVLYEKYISFKDNVTSHTAFDLASVTKTFTSMAILKQMEEGKLNLDDAVVKYLPEFPFADITIKMLLSHKSGLEDYLKFIDESGWDKSQNLTNKDLLRFMAANKSKVLVNTPGKVFDYSNTNFAMLSLIIERVSGLLYKDYLANTFFKPLGMNDTYVLDINNFATATRSYYKNGKTYQLRYLDLVTGDKCVYSTVQDLKKWDKALRGNKLFKKTTLDLAYAPTSLLTPLSSNYGLGWKKIVTTNGNEIIYHTGWWAGNRSILIRLPKDNTMIAVVSNNNFTNIADIRKLCDLFGNYQMSNNKIPNF